MDIKTIRESMGIYSAPTEPYQFYEDQMYGENRKGLEYMVKQRRILASTLQNFHVGYNQNEIVIPVFKEGKLIDYKFRGITEKTFRRHPESETWILNDIALQTCEQEGELICVEGEIDAMSLWQLGFKNVISTTGGAQAPTPWVTKIPANVKVYINYDNDEPGQEAAQKLAERIGIERCFNVEWSLLKDANEFLLANGTKKGFQEMLDQAKKFRIKDVFRVDEVLDRLENNRLQRVPVFSERLTSHLEGGIPAKSLVTISGKSGVGKSTVLMNMLVHHADAGKPVLLVSLENDLFFTIQRLLEIKYQKSYTEFTKSEWANIRKEMADYPFYIDVSMDSYTLPKVEKIIDQAKKLYGIEFFGFDHIGFLPTRDDPKEISQMVRGFKLIARQFNIIIYMVSHVRKSNNQNDYLTGDELKGSSSISQDSDIVLLVVDTKAGLEISIDKARMSKSKLRIPVTFDGPTGVVRDDMTRVVKHYDEEIGEKQVQVTHEFKEDKVEEVIEY